MYERTGASLLGLVAACLATVPRRLLPEDPQEDDGRNEPSLFTILPLGEEMLVDPGLVGSARASRRSGRLGNRSTTLSLSPTALTLPTSSDALA